MMKLAGWMSCLPASETAVSMEQEVCIGCGRTVQEIIRWGDADDKEKLEILLAAKTRRADRAG